MKRKGDCDMMYWYINFFFFVFCFLYFCIFFLVSWALIISFIIFSKKGQMVVQKILSCEFYVSGLQYDIRNQNSSLKKLVIISIELTVSNATNIISHIKEPWMREKFRRTYGKRVTRILFWVVLWCKLVNRRCFNWLYCIIC